MKITLFVEKRHAQSGITLVELLVVIALLGIIAVMAVPNMVGYVPKWRVKNAATDLFGNLQFARNTAIKESRDCTVSFSQTKYTITCNGRTVRAVSLNDYKSGVKFKTTSAPSMEFTPAGFVENNSFSAQLTNSGETRQYTIRALVSGVISMDKD